MMTVVIGLDLSLASTGLAVIRNGEVVRLERLPSKGKADDGLRRRGMRLMVLKDAILCRIDIEAPDLVVVEGPSYGQASQRGQHDRSGLWWLVVLSTQQGRGIPVAEVTPNARAKYGAGKGNAGKDAVLAAVIRRYLPVEVAGNDEADALVLAAMGARWLGEPIETSLPQNHLAAMDAVKWPTLNPERRSA